MKVRGRPDSNVQCMGPNSKIHSCNRLCETGVEKGSGDGLFVAFLADSMLLFHGQVWGPRMDDNAGIVPRAN